MKHNVSTKLGLCLLLLAFSLTAESQFNFNVVNKTGYTNNPVHGFLKLNDEPDHYRLTSADSWQTVAMWSNTKIDLTKDFIIDMNLKFGRLESPYQKRKEQGADGIAFVMHQFNTTNLIGDGGGYMGYGYTYSRPAPNGILAFDSIKFTAKPFPGVDYTPSEITSSFAVEFDTYSWGNDWDKYYEDEQSDSHLSNNHISYLQNGSMDAINGTKQLQNNWESVENGNKYCVRIQWKRTNGINADLGYDLITYIVELSTGILTERNRMHFDNISALVSSASNTNSKVTWGITSATGNRYSRQEVTFIRLIN